MPDFYRYRERDFRWIPARHLQQGDSLAYGIGTQKLGAYGAISLHRVLRIDDDMISISYHLPPGIIISSTPTRTIAIQDWHGSLPVIEVQEYLDAHADVQILAR